MTALPTTMDPDDPGAASLTRLMSQFLDPAWYLTRYPDIAAAGLDPLQHFIRYGASEQRDPNPFFDSVWYIEHHPDVAASGLNPLLHYLRAGAAELRNPHPRFDAAYYVEQHPAAAANPVLYHLQVGAARGYLTEKSINIQNYLPSTIPSMNIPTGIFADVVIHVRRGGEAAMRCIRSVLSDRAFPLARIIVVDDGSSKPDLSTWLKQRADQGDIHLLHVDRRMGFIAGINLGVDAADGHDVVLLDSDTEVPARWLLRLAAHAYSHPDVATVTPLSDRVSVGGRLDHRADSTAWIDQACLTANAGRSAEVPSALGHCMYIRHAVLAAAGGDFTGNGPAAGFCYHAADTGWRHLIACDTFVGLERSHPASTLQRSKRHATPEGVIPYRFAATAGVFRYLKLPVILMVSHNLGGGVRRHVASLVQRYHDTARVLLLEGTNRGATLSVPSCSDEAVLTLPADRLDDLVTVLRSINVSRIHIHHLLQMDMNIRALIHRLGVPFDVTVHDYHGICPQINLLRWPEGSYCDEPGPAVCNACIADQSSHGARDIVSWRRDRIWQFLDADRVICPSADVKARLDRHGIGARAIVVPHEQQMDTTWAVRLPKFRKPPLRIALLGVLANHKGARIVAEVAEAAATGTIELHLIGHVENSFPKPAIKRIKATGPYDDADLPMLLQKIDPHVFWFPSSAAETYSFTLSTAIASGLPIVAVDFGSFTERLAGRPQTWLVDHRASSSDWLATFDEVQNTLRNRVKPAPVSRPRIVSDFYTHRYLSPTPHKSSIATMRKPKIAIVPERYETGGMTPCAYIRLLQPLDHPAIGGSFDVTISDIETIFDYSADIIVTQRYAIPDLDTVNRLAEHARRIGAKLLFDLDDDLLNVPDSHTDAERIQPFADVVKHMLKIADVVWVSTPELAKTVAPICPDAIVVENRLDERIWSDGPAPTPFWDDPVRILCMGTSTHDRDFALIEPVLLQLKAEYGNRIAVDVIGMTGRSELPAELNRIGPSTHASRSYPGFVNWLTSIRPRWHIGLAPLLDTAFNRSKSPLKAMDYAAMGLTVLASDTPAYRGSLADGPAGRLVANDLRVWHAELDWLIRNQDLREMRMVQAHSAFLTQATLASDAEIRRAMWERLLPTHAVTQGAGLRDAPSVPIIPHGSTHPATRTRRHSSRGR